MTEPISVIQHVEAALRSACSFDRNDRMPPSALLWADKQREWLPVVARLAASLPIVTLGEYDGERTGPAIWIRCVVDRTLGEVPVDDVRSSTSQATTGATFERSRTARPSCSRSPSSSTAAPS